MGKSLAKFVVCHSNDFGGKKNIQIQKWVVTHGGTFRKELTSDVTHFISSEQAWKKYLPIVRDARRQKKTKIVSLDWLEDSILSKNRRPKDATPYLWETAKKREISKAQEVPANDRVIEASLMKFEVTCAEFQKETGHADHHLYVDPTNFTYLITLVRADVLRNLNEHHHLKIFESNSQPRTYSVYSIYSSKGSKAAIAWIAPVGSSWEFAWERFRWFFKKKTGVAWESRLTPRFHKCCENINEAGACDHFEYRIPGRGKPKGLVLGKPQSKKEVDTLPELTVLVPGVEVDEQDLDCKPMRAEDGL